MTKPLRLGVAGLGVVGTSLIRLLQRRRAGFAARAGREYAVVAYSARRKGDRGVDLGDAVYFASAAELAASADIDIFVELIGGAEGAALDAVKAALALMGLIEPVWRLPMVRPEEASLQKIEQILVDLGLLPGGVEDALLATAVEA